MLTAERAVALDAGAFDAAVDAVASDQARSPLRRAASRAPARSASAVCGVIGFQQHFAVWASLFGGIGWLLATDHATFLFRRLIAPRVQARLDRWQRSASRLGVRTRLIAPLHALVVSPQRLANVPYRIFALVNAADAVAWGVVFVLTGYVLADVWYGGRPNGTSTMFVMTTSGASLSVGLATAVRSRRRQAARSDWKDLNSHGALCDVH